MHSTASDGAGLLCLLHGDFWIRRPSIYGYPHLVLTDKGKLYAVTQFPKDKSHDNPGHSQGRPEFSDDVGGYPGIPSQGIEKTLDEMIVHGMKKHPRPNAS